MNAKEIAEAASSLGEIRVQTDVDLAALSAFALLELCRCFVSSAATRRRAVFSKAKRRAHDGIEQIVMQLGAELERRRRSESGPASPLILVFTNVESAGFLAAFLGGLAETYVVARAKVPKQGELEREILDIKGVAFACSAFCRSVAAAINQHELEV